MKKIAILIETQNKTIKSSMFGVITAAQCPDYQLIALVFEEDAKKYTDPLQLFGINKIVSITSGSAEVGSNPDRRARAIIKVMDYLQIDTLFALTSLEGKEVLPRIAAQLDAPLVMDCLGVNLADSTVEKPLFSGKTIATIRVTGTPQLFGIRPNMIEPKPKPTDTEIFSYDADLPPDSRFEVVEQKGGQAGVSLSEADIIISGGRGMQNGENFQILHECAKVMGAAVGASRVAVDAGWVPHSMQVGQTGATVCPKLYIACGISGSVQHFAGMKTAATIVCINTDPKAAMMQQCDYGIVGDLFEVVPILTRQLKEGLKIEGRL